MFKLLIKHCNAKKFKVYYEPPTPSHPAPIILLSVPRNSLVRSLEKSFHPVSYYVKLTVRWWRWSKCIVTKFLLNRDYQTKEEKNSLNYNSFFWNSRRHDKVSRRHSELAPGIFRALLWHVLHISLIHCLTHTFFFW